MTNSRGGADYHAEEIKLDVQAVPGLLRRGSTGLARDCVDRAREQLDRLAECIDEDGDSA